MPITRLNHAVLYVTDVSRSVAFYTVVLGFRVVPIAPEGFKAAFLQAPGSTNDHDLGLFEVGAGAGPPRERPSVGLYHLAWEVDTLAELERVAAAMRDAGALGGASDHGTTKSLYGHDPDGIDFEVAWIVPAERLDAAAQEARTRIGVLDLEREKARYGADTPGGIGVSAGVGGPQPGFANPTAPTLRRKHAPARESCASPAFAWQASPFPRRKHAPAPESCVLHARAPGGSPNPRAWLCE